MSKTLWRRSVVLLALSLAAHGFAQSDAPDPGTPDPGTAAQSTPAQDMQSPTAPQIWTWDTVKSHFETSNPTLLAGELNVQELRAQEITANLRPNPDFTFTADGTQVSPYHGVWEPFAGTYLSPGVSELFERRHKRGLRYQAAKEGTAVGIAQQSDLERTLLFNLRSAFVGVLQAKAVLKLSVDNLAYYDKILKISRDRYEAGDIAQIDLDRLELGRLQYESDLQNAIVNLRTTKITLLAMLDDRRTIDSFDVDGPFDFTDQLASLDYYRKDALDTRPDLKAAILTVQQSHTNYKLAEANGSTDPTISVWYTHNGSYNNPDDYNTIGASVSIPLRIFDRNQGEKLRTKIDITHSEKLERAAEAQVYNDVDTAYETVNGNIVLLKPYKSKYLEQAVRVRDTVFFSYQHGGASLLDFLNAESDYRTVQLSYVNLVGTYLTSAAQLNEAVGREVIP
jgi:outer membrane protein, heavy metal efflux system